MNKLLFITNLLMGSVLSRFAISKLSGWEISVKAFIEMAHPLGIDPTLFRISTGVMISIAVLGYIVTAIFSLVKNKPSILNLPFTKWATLTNLFGLLAMLGALTAEFSLRVNPKWMLVYIAIGIVILSATNIYILNTQKQITKN